MRTAAILIAGALVLTACERSSPPAEKAETKPRTLGEIDSAVAQLEDQNKRLEASVRKLEQGAMRWVMWRAAWKLARGEDAPVDIRPAGVLDELRGQ